MEDYLIKEYGVIEDKRYLTSDEDILPYFKDNGYKFFDCGHGYYQESAKTIVKIGNEFIAVTILADIQSAKQDGGERLYWVENIKDVILEDMDKPKPLIRKNYLVTMNNLSMEQLSMVKQLLKENNIEYKIKS